MYLALWRGWLLKTMFANLPTPTHQPRGPCRTKVWTWKNSLSLKGRGCRETGLGVNTWATVCVGERGYRGRCCLGLRLLSSPSSRPPSLTFKTPRPCVYCPTPAPAAGWPPAGPRLRGRRRQPYSSPQASPGLHGAPTPPPGRPPALELSFVSHHQPQLSPLLLLFSALCPGLPKAACQSDCMSGLCPGHWGLGLPQSCFSGQDGSPRGLERSRGAPGATEGLCLERQSWKCHSGEQRRDRWASQNQLPQAEPPLTAPPQTTPLPADRHASRLWGEAVAWPGH